MRLTAAILGAALCLGSGYAVTGLGIVKGDLVNLREAPSLDGPVKTRLSRGTPVEILDSKDPWLLVALEDRTPGWIHKDLIERVAADPTPTPQPLVQPEAQEEEKVEAAATQPTEPQVSQDVASEVTSELADSEDGPGEVSEGPLIGDPHPVSREPPRREFREISLSLMPGYSKATAFPAGFDKTALSAGARVTIFAFESLALGIPYVFAHYDSGATFHSVGGGPVVRIIESEYVRLHAEGALLYVRAFGNDRMGWLAGGDLAFGLRRAGMRPFIGPFFRYQRTYVPGRDAAGYTIGAAFTLTNLADLD